MSEATRAPAGSNIIQPTVAGPFELSDQPKPHEVRSLLSHMPREIGDEVLEASAWAATYSQLNRFKAEELWSKSDTICRREVKRLNAIYWASMASNTALPESDRKTEDETATRRSAPDESIDTEASKSIIPTGANQGGELR